MVPESERLRGGVSPPLLTLDGKHPPAAWNAAGPVTPDMQIKLYNTLTRSKEALTPLDPRRVRMYVCGPTVYDFAHIGNARPVIVFDVLFRLLRHVYGADHVTYVRNITDVDDKINARAAERGISIRELTETTYENYRSDVAALGCLPPTAEPRATDYVRRSDGQLDMITLIERLIVKGHAYAAEGHVLFAVGSMHDYGKLSRRPLDEMIAGARVEVAPYKRDAMDFVLWKPSAAHEPGWDSSWGRGRPGWHIECSAMTAALLGETFDIHGGGIDLVFPHHENEIAQSRCAFGSDLMAQIWMHNGFLQVEGEKMAKSAGNFVTIRELLADWPGEVLRFNMLRTHYRQPIDWTIRRLEESQRTLKNWANVLERQQTFFGSESDVPANVLNALIDDLNTPLALAEMHKLAEGGRKGDHLAAQALHRASEFLHLFTHGTQDEASVGRAAGELMPSEFRRNVESKVALRKAARARKDFAESDRIRDELAAMGIVLKDSKDGTTWEIAR